MFHFLEKTLKRLLKRSASEHWILAQCSRSEAGALSIHPTPRNRAWEQHLLICKPAAPSQTHTSSLLNSSPWNFQGSSLKEVFFSLSFFNLHPPQQWEMKRTPKPEAVLWTHHHCWEPQKTLSLWLRGNGHSQIIKISLVCFRALKNCILVKEKNILECNKAEAVNYHLEFPSSPRFYGEKRTAIFEVMDKTQNQHPISNFHWESS